MAANPNALVNAQARAAIGPAATRVLQESLAASLRTLFLVAAIVTVLALAVSFTLPPGKPGGRPASGEEAVMAEMTTIDAEHEPSL